MAKYLLGLVEVLFLLSVSSACACGKKDSGVKAKALKSSDYSPFTLSFYHALKSEKIFDKLFDVSFRPINVGPQFYHNIRHFMMELGVKNPVYLPAKVAASAEKAFQNITPLKYFEAFAAAKERTFKSAGVLKKHGEDHLAKAFASTLKKSVKSVGGSGPKSALKALAKGSVNFFKIVGKFTPTQIRNHIKGFIAEISKGQH